MRLTNIYILVLDEHNQQIERNKYINVEYNKYKNHKTTVINGEKAVRF